MNAPNSTSYDIYFVLNDKRFFWKNPNHGVTITDAGRESCLTWQAEDGAAQQLWTDISTITMSTGSDGKAEVNQCRIVFRDGRALTLTDAGPAGTVDHARTPVYRDCVRALHARLAQAPSGTIAFRAGASEGRYLGMKIILGIAALFFVGTPFVLLFIVRDWRVLLTLAAGAAFVWPFYKIIEKSKPRTYDPKFPPGELME